jgi:hypothetical protein
VGDYLLQPKKMALRKANNNLEGWLWCLAHSLIYTGSICLLAQKFNWVFGGLVFLSHFPIDKWSLAAWWLKLIKGRDILEAAKRIDQDHLIDLVFACIVYTVTDNTWHLLILWLVCNFFF